MREGEKEKGDKQPKNKDTCIESMNQMMYTLLNYIQEQRATCAKSGGHAEKWGKGFDVNCKHNRLYADNGPTNAILFPYNYITCGFMFTSPAGFTCTWPTYVHKSTPKLVN